MQKLGGYASISSSATLNILNENTVSYDKTIDKHQFNIISGYTYQQETTESFSAIGQGFTNDLLTYNNLSTGDPLLAKNSSNYSDWTILSLLGRINYAFNNKYLFTVSVREDGSSRLAKNNKYAFFPSAAFSWRMNEESFMKDLDLFSSLKFRASYGKTGNQAIAVYSTLPSLNISNAWFNSGQNIGYTLGNIPNDDLKWETTDQYNVGLDMGLIHGRFSFTADAYYKKTYNLLLSAQIPGTTGYSSRLDNIGTVENRGLELTFDGKILNTKMLTWDIGFNLAMNRNKVLDLGKNITYRDLTDGARLIVGQPAPVFYGAIFEGVFKSQAEIDALPNYQSGLKPGYVKFKDNNGNGKYDGLADYDIMGNPEPKFFGGLSSSLKYKRFGLNAYFNYSYGNDIINSFGPRLFAGEYASNVGKIALDRWTPVNNQSNIPGVGASAAINVNSQAFSFAVQDGSFLRLKTLQLTYSLPVNKIKWLQDASIYFTGNNLFNLNNYSWGFDPEVNSSGTDPVLRGFDGYTYPQNRSFILGINLKF
jgi:TonB-linked SusC/RagA family outer membrane protein